MKTLGERLKVIRDLRGFSQKQVAAVLRHQRPN